MSVTDPSTPRDAGARARSRAPRRSAPRWDHRLTYALSAVGALVVLAVFVVYRTYPNYDTYYTLVWGKELGNWQLPDYDVFRTPTPHPLSTLVGWAMAPFGTASDRILVLASLFGLLAFYVVSFVFTERLLGPRDRADRGRGDADAHRHAAARAARDVRPAVLPDGLRRGAAGAAPAALRLAGARACSRSPGCCRPEAWLLAGVYWLYLAPVTPRPVLIRYALLVVAAPLIWMAWDLIVTGEPLYSLTSTREVSGEFGRNRGLLDAIEHIPEYSGGNDRIVTVGVGGLGLLLAVYILRRRAALPLALGGARRGDVPDHRRRRPVGDPALHDDPVAAALALRRGRARRLDAGRGADAAAGGDRDRGRLRAGARLARAVLLRATSTKLADQATFIEAQHKGLKGSSTRRGPSRRCSAAARSRCRRTPRSR